MVIKTKTDRTSVCAVVLFSLMLLLAASSPLPAFQNDAASGDSILAINPISTASALKQKSAAVNSKTAVPSMLASSSSTGQGQQQINSQPRWVKPVALINELKKLESDSLTSSWSAETAELLNYMTDSTKIADPDSKIIIQALGVQLEKLNQIADLMARSPQLMSSAERIDLLSQIHHLQYSISRRLEVWPLVHQLSLQPAPSRAIVSGQQANRFRLVSHAKIGTPDINPTWADYLQVEPAAAILNSTQSDESTKRQAARFALARLFNPALSKEQNGYLRANIDQQLVDSLRSHAIEPVDLGQFVKRLEKLEHNDSGASQHYLNDLYQSLYWSDHPLQRKLAKTIDTHYRNANFRVSISESMLNGMIPQLPSTSEPYRDRFLGADLVGRNRISSRLEVNLIPDPEQISMQVVTHGRVNSHTTATRSGVVVENEGVSRFRSIKRLAFGQSGIFSYRPETSANVAQRVVGLRSNLDNVPGIGWIVRKIAQNKIREQAPVSERYAKNQVEMKAEEVFEQKVEEALTELENTLTNNLLHPLVAMDLEPEPINISTSADRVNMRYRLAGRDQLASHTSRPQANQACLMSMQVHESVANNFLDRYELAGKKFTTGELIQYANEIFGKPIFGDDTKSKKKLADVEFAPYDPIRFDFDNNQIAISLNFKSLRLGKGKRWKNLNIKATYDTEVVNGFNVGLNRGDERLKIKGKRLNVGDRLAINLICEVFFPEKLQVALVPDALANKLSVSNVETTQFVISKGWIGISVDEVTGVLTEIPKLEAQADSKNRFSRRFKR